MIGLGCWGEVGLDLIGAFYILSCERSRTSRADHLRGSEVIVSDDSPPLKRDVQHEAELRRASI